MSRDQLFVRSPRGTNDLRIVLEYKGAEYPLLKNHPIGIMTPTIHYDREIFEDPKRFWPDRFLDAERPVPRNAYRPFERGLRACIGQALAMNELKISRHISALARLGTRWPPTSHGASLCLHRYEHQTKQACNSGSRFYCHACRPGDDESPASRPADVTRTKRKSSKWKSWACEDGFGRKYNCMKRRER